MEDIADDEDFFAGEIGVNFAEGEGIEQRLRWMRVGTIAGIDDAGIGHFGDGGGEAGAAVADDDVVRAHRLQGLDGFAHGFTLGDGGGGDIEVRDIGGEAFGGDLEGGVGASGGLVEQHQHAFALEGGDLFHRAGEDFLKRRGLVEKSGDLFRGQRVDV